ncbi:MAG: hypothetical protein JWQ60_6331 [Pseudonocardia sp.]|nr:hypothetical protein [Pseudonocardia sp.]
MAAGVRAGVAQPGREDQRPVDVPAELVLVGETDGAVQLHGLVPDPQRRRGGPGLRAARGQRQRVRADPVRAGPPQCAVHRGAGEPLLDPQVDGAVPQRLEAADRPAELAAGGQVAQRQLEHPVDQPEQLGGADQGAGVDRRVQGVARRRPAAQYGAAGQPDAVEVEAGPAGAVGRVPRRHGHPRGAPIDPDQHDLPGGPGRDQVRVGRIGRDPGHAAAQHQAVAVGPRLDRQVPGHHPGVALAALGLPGQHRERVPLDHLGQQCPYRCAVGETGQAPRHHDAGGHEGLAPAGGAHTEGDHRGGALVRPRTAPLRVYQQGQPAQFGVAAPAGAVRTGRGGGRLITGLVRHRGAHHRGEIGQQFVELAVRVRQRGARRLRHSPASAGARRPRRRPVATARSPAAARSPRECGPPGRWPAPSPPAPAPP